VRGIARGGREVGFGRWPFWLSLQASVLVPGFEPSFCFWSREQSRDRSTAHGSAASTCGRSTAVEAQSSAGQTGAKPSEATGIPLVLFSVFTAMQGLDKYATARVDG